MGFFKSVGKVFSRAVTAVATSGASEIARKVAPAAVKPLEALYAPTNLKQVLPVVASVVTANPGPIIASVASSFAAYQSGSYQNVPVQEAQPMAFNVGQFLGGVNQAFGGSSNQYLSGFGQLAGMASAFVPQQAAAPVVYAQGGGQAYPVGNTVNLPAKIPTNGMTKDIFDAASKLLARLGIPVRSASGFIPAAKRALSGVASLARRTPAGTVISLLTGLGLTAMEANLLVSWQAQRRKHRRMNPANSKALRRAARRIKSFHKLCQHTDLIKTRHHRAAPARSCGKR